MNNWQEWKCFTCRRHEMSSRKNLARLLTVFLGLVFIFSTAALNSTKAQAKKRVALIIAQGGLGDRSYNDLGFAGLTKAAQDFEVEVRPIESSDPVGQAEQLIRS